MKKPSLLLFICSSLFLSALTITGYTGVQWSVPYYWQGNKDTCWASCSSMLAKYYLVQAPDQVQIKQWWAIEHTQVDINNTGGTWTDYTVTLAAMSPQLSFHSAETADHESTKLAIVDRLENGHPVLFRSRDNSIGNHAVVITGYEGTNDATGLLYLHDPSGGLFKNMIDARLCNLELTWATFFDAIDTSAAFDGYIIAAMSGTGRNTGTRVTMDLCPAHTSSTIATTNSGVNATFDGGNYLDFELAAPPHPGYRFSRTGSTHSPTVGGRNYAYKLTNLDQLNVAPMLNCTDNADMDVQVTTEFECAGTMHYTFVTNLTVSSYTHSYNDIMAVIPVGDFAGSLVQEECQIVLTAKARTNGTADAFTEQDRLVFGCRVELAGHVASRPEEPNDQAIAVPGHTLTFTADYASCSQGHETETMFDWGDSAFTDWSTNTQAEHSWASEGTYEIRARSRCSTVQTVTSLWTEAHSVDVGTATRHYVSPNGAHVWPYTNWPDASTNVQDGINSALAGEIVVITNGTYVLPYELLLWRAVTVTGLEGATSTILDAEDKFSCFYLGNEDAVIDGLTLTRGCQTNASGGAVHCYGGGTVQNCILSESHAQWGGGIYLKGGGSLYNSVVMNNSAVDTGGGAYCYYDGLVSNCLIIGNQSRFGGGSALWYGGTLDDCQVVSNTAQFGGGTYARFDGGWIRNSTFTDNHGASRAGGVYCSGGGAVRDSTFSGNTSSNGAGVYIGNTGLVQNCVFSNNYSLESGGGVLCSKGGVVKNTVLYNNTALGNRGGGIYCFEGGEVFNCTVVSNEAPWAGGVYCRNGGTVFNCIIYDNECFSGSPNWRINGTGILCSHNCTTPAIPLLNGDSNITDTPLFIDAAARDYNLQQSSACIDAGTNLSEVLIDFAYVVRPLDGLADSQALVDIGAYEFASTNSDTDADSASDYHEVCAGTDPTDPASIFILHHMDLPSTGMPYYASSLSWDTVPDRTYTVLMCTNLMINDWVPVADVAYTNITGSGNTVTYTNSDANPCAFFRVDVR